MITQHSPLPFFSQKDLEGLSPEEKQFAIQQFKLLYSQQMSKAIVELNNKKRVVDNLHALDLQQEQGLKEQYQNLKKKMSQIQSKRNKQIQEKIKQYKHNDERWLGKMKEIQERLKIKNLEAIEKAQKYREESETYWKSKEQRSMNNSGTNLIPVKSVQKVRTIKSLSNNTLLYDLPSKEAEHPNRKQNRRKTIDQEYSLEQKNRSQNKSLNEQIRIHQQKSQNMQREKQKLVFEKALSKMQKISKKREIIHRKCQSKPAAPTVPRRIRDQQDFRRDQEKSARKSSVRKVKKGLLSLSRESLDNSIRQHQEVKKSLEEEQFMHRGEIMENSAQRARRQRILKMIKGKVQEVKVETLRKQNSKLHL